jgi:hypothetical protein
MPLPANSVTLLLSKLSLGVHDPRVLKKIPNPKPSDRFKRYILAPQFSLHISISMARIPLLGCATCSLLPLSHFHPVESTRVLCEEALSYLRSIRRVQRIGAIVELPSVKAGGRHVGREEQGETIDFLTASSIQSETSCVSRVAEETSCCRRLSIPGNHR